MTVGPATAAFVARVEPIIDRVSPAAAAELAEIVDRASGPFVVAVVGRLKSGKSTLVNAVLGQAVAATAVGECTKIVTRYVRGDSDMLLVRRTDGSKYELPFVDVVPADLGDTDVAELEVHVTSSSLDELVVVDTPGLASLVVETSQRTEDFLDLASSRACADADALVYLLNHVARQDDTDVLRAFIRSAGDRAASSVVGVLNKADQISGGLDAARKQAAVLERRLSSVVQVVVPVVAVAAEAARCGLLKATDVDVCAQLATLPATQRELMRDDAALLESLAADVGKERIDRLVRILGPFGIGLVVDHLADNPRDRAGHLQRLEEVSGFAQFDAALNQLRRRSDAIKARRAVTALDRLKWSREIGPADRAALGNLLHELSRDAALDVIEQLDALDLAVADPGLLSRDEYDEIASLFSAGPASERAGVPPSEVATRSRARAAHWRSISATPSDPPKRRQIASVAYIAYLAMLELHNSQSRERTS